MISNLDPDFDRSTGVGASDAPAACGLSPYEQTTELYLEKIGGPQAAISKQSRELMLFGTCIEAGGIRFWSELNETPVTYPLPTRRHPTVPYMYATPDAQIAERRGLQFKSMDFRMAKQIDDYGLAEIAPNYVVQVQQEMAVCDWDEVLLVALVGRKLREWPVERNDRLINLIIEREGVFWDHVQRRIPPDIDFTKPGAKRAVELLYPEIREGAVIRLSDDAGAAWEAYEKLGAEAKKIKEQQESHKAFVLNEIGENFAGLLPDGSRMLRRKLIRKKSHMVAECEYIDFRATKYDGSPITDSDSLRLSDADDDSAESTETVESLAERIDAKLRANGFLCHHASPSGSRYYVHDREGVRFRVSDHHPNEKTAEWMARVDCRDVNLNDVLKDVGTDGMGAINAFISCDVISKG